MQYHGAKKRSSKNVCTLFAFLSFLLLLPILLLFFLGLDHGEDIHHVAFVVPEPDHDLIALDGLPDLLVSRAGAAPALVLNEGGGRFRGDPRSDGALAGISGDARFLDFDNDGWLDLVGSGPDGPRLLHNDGSGRFVDRSAEILSPDLAAARP